MIQLWRQDGKLQFTLMGDTAVGWNWVQDYLHASTELAESEIL